MIASRCSRCTPSGSFIARGQWIAILLIAIGATPAAAGTVVGVSMIDPSIVSDTAGGELDNSRNRMLSDDGRWLVFQSQGTDLVPGYTGTGRQIYLYDRQTAAVTLVSRANGSPTLGGNGESFQSAISGGGAYVAFYSASTDLVSGGSGPSTYNVYLWERSSGATTLVSESMSAAGQRGNNNSTNPVVSGDGAYVVFQSFATDLASGGSGPTSYYNVYVWERSSGTTTLVSQSVVAAGQRGNDVSISPVISDDGATVAFLSYATDLVPSGAGPSAFANVYVWERSSGATTLVTHSVSAAGQRGNSVSASPVISSDGAIVAFSSQSTDLVSGGSGPGNQNVYVWERSSGTTTLVSESVSAAGLRGNGYSQQPVISGDGAYVAFQSNATDLVAGGAGPTTYNLYVWERSSGTTTLVSESASVAGQRGNNTSDQPTISGDGAYLAFSSDATDLVLGGSGPSATNLYVWDRASGATTLVSESMSAAGQRGNNHSFNPVISGDGAYVAFGSSASDLVASDGMARDVFLCEVGTGTVVAASRRDTGTPWAPTTGNGASQVTKPLIRSISSDGAYVAFYSFATDLVAGGSGPTGYFNVYLWERSSGTTTLVSESISAVGRRGNGASYHPAISGDGAYVVFTSFATDLVTGSSGPLTGNVYLWERLTGETTLVSESVSAAGQRGSNGSNEAVISSNGAYVAFLSSATDLVTSGSGPSTQNVYVWERSSGTTTLASESVAAAGQRGSSGSYQPVISDDGAAVAFQSDATDLVTGGSGPSTGNVYVWEHSTGETILVSESASAAGQRGNNGSYQAAISGDGSTVAFSSAATDLVIGGSGPSTWNIYVWERSSGATTLASESASAAAQRGDNHSLEPVISGDGATVAFHSQATNLVIGGSGPSTQNVYVWERSSGETTLVSESVSTAGQRGNNHSTQPTISADGADVAFKSTATDLASGASGPATENVYTWAQSSGATTLVSQSISVADRRGNGTSSPPVISGDGGYVAFQSAATDLISRDFNNASDVLLWSAGAPADTTAPTDPAALAAQAPHVENAWSNQATVTMEWSGAADEVGGSGLAGYSVEWNTTPVSTPDAVVDVVHGADPHSTTSPPLAEGTNHYFHLRTCDLAGNCSSTLHRGPYDIDLTSPSIPGGVSSSTHVPGIASTEADLSVAWAAATDVLSGVAGYSWALDSNPTWSCEQVADGDESITAATFPALSDGSYYLHVCAVDEAGNWGLVRNAGPYVVSLAAPSSDLFVYYSRVGAGEIRRVRANGFDDSLVLGGLSAPVGLAVDPRGGKIYVALAGTNAIARCNLDGTGPETLVSSAGGPYGVALDVDSGKIYWAARSAGEIRRANLDGTGVEAVLTALQQPTGVAFDRTWRKVYWSEDSFAPAAAQIRLGRSEPDGSGMEVLLTLPGATNRGYALDVDPVAQKVYWVNTQVGGGTVRVLNYDGTGDAALVSGLAPAEIEIDPSSGHLFWSEEQSGTVRRAAFDGSSPVTLSSGGNRWGTSLLIPESPPVALAQVLSVPEDGQVAVRLRAYDPDNDALSWSVTVPPAHGTLSGTAPELIYTPEPDFIGSDSFEFQVDDSISAPATATIAISVTAVDEAPSDPTSLTAMAPHVEGGWSNQTAITMTWSGAADDPMGSGLDGYSVEWNASPISTPDASLEVDHTIDPHSFGAALAEGGGHYFHLRTCDNGGNCTSTLHAGPFWIDTAAPSAPGAVSSTSHDGGPTNDATIDVAWGAASDALSGIDGYSYFFNGVDEDCDGTTDSDFDERAATSLPLAAGTWYFHVCAVDFAGNWGAVATGGPYTIDLSAPKVTNVDSVATSGGAIGEGEVVDVEITQLLVSFDEPIDATLAENPGNYLLIFGGSDGTLDTAACGPLQGDDQSLSVDSATYAGVTSTLTVNGATALADGIYRLLVCATLADVAGNPLDGDGDGGPGDDFARSFRVDLTPPTVVLVDTVADTGDGVLSELEPTNVAITALSVTFDEEIVGGAISSNFLLVEGGLDGALETTACGPPAGDDTSIAIDSAVYASLTTTLALNGGVALADGEYRLLVCATLTDLGGNALDGDDDGDGHDDFARTFTVDTVPPTNPTAISSSTHGLGAWSSVTGFAAEWSGGGDDRSGLAGASVVIDGNPDTAVDCTIEVAGAAGTGTTAATLGEGAWYVHLRLVDRAGNCAVGEAEAGFWGIDTSAPGAPGAISSPSHDPVSTPVSDATIDVEWGAASDALSGVASYLYLFDGSPSGNCLGGSTASLSATSGALGDGSWYLHVCAVDLAGNTGAVIHGGPWIVDTTLPAGLAVSSSSHSVSTWSNDNSADFGFSGATDGNGIAGYAVAYDRASATEPACAATQAGITFTGISSPDAGDWWIHVRAVDGADNCGSTVHLGPFQIDTQSPAAPTGLDSTSHDVGVASNDDTVDVEWMAALDQAGLSGIDGYGFFFSTGEDDDCDGEIDVEEDVLQATSAALADGEHHFHLCSVDNAGNWSPVASIGPFVIDTAGAAVVAIGTVADTGDGDLAEGEATAVGLTQLTVVFDGAMRDATGDTDPADVTNPENYRLYQGGADRVVQTVTCGTAIGDDVEVAFAAASFSASTTTTALSLPSSLALPRESYRLLVCPTLEDDAGTTIPGFTRNFTVTTTDLAANPNFDHDLAGWVVTDPVPGGLLWSSSDLSSAPTSGSAEIVTAFGAGAVWALSQCFADLAGPFVSSGWTTVESSVPSEPVVGVRLDFFDGAGCSGVLLDSTLSPPVAGDTGGLRTYLQLARNGSPEAALSVLMTVEVEGGVAASFTVRLDDLFHGRPPALFADGFESSDTSAWSDTIQ